MPPTDPDIENLDLPSEVALRAQEILERIRKNHPKLAQKKVEIFFAVYNAFRELGVVCLDTVVADKLEVGAQNDAKLHSKIKGILKIFYRAGYPSPLVTYSPLDYVEVCSEAAGLPQNEYPRIRQLITKTMDQFPKRTKCPPGVVAAGIISYYSQNVIGRSIDETALLALLGCTKHHTALKTVASVALQADIN